MTVSEKLGALEKGHLRTFPLFRGTAVDEDGSGFLRARDIEAVMDALPQIVALVQAAEKIDKPDRYGSFARQFDLHTALLDLDEALS